MKKSSRFNKIFNNYIRCAKESSTRLISIAKKNKKRPKVINRIIKEIEAIRDNNKKIIKDFKESWKFYDAEDVIKPYSYVFTSFKEANNFLENIVNCPKFKKSYPSIKKIKLKIDYSYTKEARGSYKNKVGKINIAEDYLKDYIVVHELAHCCHQSLYKKIENGHDKNFALILINLVTNYLDKKRSNKLYTSFKKSGILN